MNVKRTILKSSDFGKFYRAEQYLKGFNHQLVTVNNVCDGNIVTFTQIL